MVSLSEAGTNRTTRESSNSLRGGRIGSTSASSHCVMDLGEVFIYILTGYLIEELTIS